MHLCLLCMLMPLASPCIYVHYFPHECMHTIIGAVPYTELDNVVILSNVMVGYRLDCPEGCPDQM